MPSCTVFDLHCDTLTAFMDPTRCPDPLNDPASAFALSRIPRGVRWCQCCAVFIPDGLTEEEAWWYYRFHRDRFFRQMERFSACALPCRTAEDVERAWAEGKTALILTVENASFLGGDLNRAEVLLANYSDHNAEWNFLKGAVCYRRGWMDEAKRYYQTACQMDPSNTEYQQALEYMENGTQNAYRPDNGPFGTELCGGGNLCSKMCCAYLLCNSCGYGGIRFCFI